MTKYEQFRISSGLRADLSNVVYTDHHRVELIPPNSPVVTYVLLLPFSPW